MKLHQASGIAGIAALAVFAGPQALAQAGGWYAGASAGRAAATIDDAGIRSGLAGQGLATASIDDHDRATAFKLLGGYQFTPNIAVEAGYFDLGHFGYSAHTVPAGTLNGDIRVRGVNLDLVGSMPLVGNLSAIGRVGVTSVRASDSFNAVPLARVPYANANPSERTTNWKAGLGLAYAVTDALSVRGEVERYRLRDAVGNNGHIDMFSVGLIYRFGATPQPRAAAPMPVVAAAPAPVMAPPPPPPPAPRPPPPAPPAPMRVTLAADSLFDFDKSAIKPDGRASLDKLASDLRGVRYDSIQVTGHTDRFGSRAYNMKLSARRAEAVAAYLTQAGVTSARMSATGVNSDKPVTRPGDCKGSKPTAAVVACLQPDRRVEVEVTGTR